MTNNTLIIDTNLLLLYVVGAASRDFISKHKRLKDDYCVEDYDALLKLIDCYHEILVTPNTLTETSNFAAYIGEPAKREVFKIMHKVIESLNEVYIPSKIGVTRKEFLRLGLTDSILIEAASQNTTVVTTDLDLFLAVKASGSSAINFNHIREEFFKSRKN